MSDFESRAPEGYICPICAGLHGEEEHTLIRPGDIVYEDDFTTALMNSFFYEGNEGHVIVVPNEHYENIYDLSKEAGHQIFDVAQMLARAIKLAYETDGTTLRQNNEPAGGQHAFHYHLHVLPRYKGDKLNGDKKTNQPPSDTYHADPAERARYATKLRTQLAITGVK